METLLLKMKTLLSYICPRTNLYTLRLCSDYANAPTDPNDYYDIFLSYGSVRISSANFYVYSPTWIF